jgi:putative endonuclease
LTTHLAIGRYGEKIAGEWLIANGFALLCRNWRYGRKEIDLIASKQGILHIIEVKTRRGKAFGQPEEQVNRRKLAYLKAAAEAYLEENPQWRKIQFNILAINLQPGHTEIILLEDIS